MSRLLITVLALAASTLAFDAAAAGNAEAGKKRAYTCTGCHGIPGYKNTYPMYSVPRIAGQSETYLVNALNKTADGGYEDPNNQTDKFKSFSYRPASGQVETHINN